MMLISCKPSFLVLLIPFLHLSSQQFTTTDDSYTPPLLTEEPQDTFVNEDETLTLKCRATATPKPSFTWYKDGNEITIEDRYSVTTEGDFVVSKFNPQDDSGSYHCVVRVPRPNIELKLLSRRAKVQSTVFPNAFKSDVSPTTAYSGGAIRLAIDATNFIPYPLIAWNFRGKPSIQNNDPRFYVLPQGVLHVYNLQTSDGGDVRAISKSRASGVKSAQTFVGQFAKLTVQAANARPSNKGFYFLGRPQDIDLQWGRTTVLEALTDSANPVTYTWYKDGKKVDLNDQRKQIVGQGNLKILYAKEEDSGTYKVVAESGGQSIEASAKLTVLSSPQFTVVPPRRVYAEVDGSARFDFKVNGSPKSTLNWYHDGVLIDASADYIEYGVDFFTVNDLIDADGGMYQARASNAGGDAEFSLELIITEPGVTTPPVITQPPTPVAPLLPGSVRNIQGYAKSPTEINLSWQEPLITNGFISSYQLLYFDTFGNSKQVTIAGSKTFFTVSGLTPDSSYDFKLKANNAMGSGPLSDVVTTKTMPAVVKVPGIVTNIKSSLNGNALSITWNAPASGPTPTKYRVYYRSLDDSTGQQYKDTTGTSLLISDLYYDRQYKFRIVPYAGLKEGTKSNDYSIVVPPAPTPDAVTALTVTPVMDSLVNIKWQPPKTRPTPDKYTIYYRNVNSPSSGMKTLDTTSNIAIVQNLEPSATYEFYVIASKNGLIGPKSMIRTVQMLDETPPAPTDLRTVSIGSQTIKIQWDPIGVFKGQLRSYKITYYEEDRPVATEKTISDISILTTDQKIEDLKPLTIYRFKVQGVSGSGAGVATPEITVKTRDITKKGPTSPANVKYIHNPDAPDVIMVKWNDPQYVSGKVNSYILNYRVKGTGKYMQRTIPGNMNAYNITNIEFDKPYEMYMYAVDDNGEGKNSPTFQLQTKKDNIEPPPPTNLIIVSKSDSISATWDPPTTSPNVIVRGYYVKIIDTYRNKEILSGKLPSRQSTNVHLYNMVKANTPYRVTVQSYNGYGNSATVQKMTKTPQVTVPAIYVTGVEKKARSIFFTWKDTIGSKTNGYNVRYTTYDANGKSKVIEKTTLLPQIDVTDLTPFTNYNFFVKRLADNSYPAAVTLKAKTKEAVPSAPLDVTGYGLTKYPTWLWLSWQVPQFPNGQIMNYFIYYSQDKNIALKDWEKKSTKGASMVYNVTGLNPKTTYYFLVQAVNGAGAGAKSAVYGKLTGGVFIPGGLLPSTGGNGGKGGVIVIPGGTANHGHAGVAHSFELWWILLILFILILLILLLLLLIWCCCCKHGSKGLAKCWSCCPCCKTCWLCCCLPFCLKCCPCCCAGKKKKHYEDKTYIAAPIKIVTGEEEKSYAAPPDLWLTGKKDNIEMMPLTGGGSSASGDADHLKTPSVKSGGHSARSSMTGATLSRQTSKSSINKIKVPTPGDTTFISYKTSLQDYCQKVGWLSPVYNTSSASNGFVSRVAFGGNSYSNDADIGTSRFDAEQKTAFVALTQLGVLDSSSKYTNDVSISVPSPGDPSFISYKCSLHDFCQQCNILPPRFSTSQHESGYTSSVQVGSHTFNMQGRVRNSQEAEQKAACIALQGLCMMDSQAGYHPEACFTVPGPYDPSFISFKSSLHDFCQRYKLPPPQYITNQGTQGYSAKLKFGGLFFQSSDYFSTRLEAEQHAAFEALQGLGLLLSSCEFGAALESNHTAGPGGGVNLTHGSGIITVGHMGGGSVPASYSSSRHGSRTGSRPPSRPGSRPPSRPGSRPSSRPGSRQGSMNHLNHYDTPTYGASSASATSGYGASSASANTTYATPQRDAQFTLGQRSYSSGGGFQGHSSGLGSTTHTNTHTSFTNGTLPRSRSKSSSGEEHYQIPKQGGNGSTYSYSMTYEHHTTSSTTTTTLPRKPPQLGIGQPNGGTPSKGYGSAQNVSHDYSYQSADTRSASHPALSDLENEMAGLEGLIKDLNGITTSGKIA